MYGYSTGVFSSRKLDVQVLEAAEMKLLKVGTVCLDGPKNSYCEKTEFDEQMSKREAKAERLTHFASKRWRRSLASSNR